MRYGPPRPKHGHNTLKFGQTPTYKAWHCMKQRCLNPKHRNFRLYGGRGITICDRWMEFPLFLADMGERPNGLTLDRIDGEGNYQPGNCRWATMKEQCNNWRAEAQFLVTYKGERYSLQQLADRLGLNRYTLRQRILKSRWPEEKWHLPANASANRIGKYQGNTPADCKPAR